MKIAITGGKGGTGKSTLATALAFALAQEKKVLLVDTDVDCPGDHLILSIKLKKVKNVESLIPKFDAKKCIRCGKCAQVCPTHAIAFVKNKNPIFIPEQCIGCKACEIVCPVKAISETKQKVGKIFAGNKKNLTLISGQLNPGIEESNIVVKAVKNYIIKEKTNYDYVIIDTAAGTHCPVISALIGSDYALAVTEPTPLGAHDLDLILTLTKKLKLKTKVVLNKADIAPGEIIKKIAKKHKTKIIAEMPYSQKIEKAYSNGKPIKNEIIQKIIKLIKK
ncbi:MAG: AAA family ATPase [Xanthomonadaceae bacterium]|nr:AAA family ATPase [Rhodospirillaceae bacterium]NIA18243.1 AAA family ATPase [Xanthomonadaceae bacterium]